MLPFALLLALVWSVMVAAFIEFTGLGRWIAIHMTWFIVATGMGGDLLILLLLVDEAGRVAWWQIVAVIAVSSVAVSLRGILEFYGYFRTLMRTTQMREVLHGAADTAGE